MATITSLWTNDDWATSRTTINTNFTNVNNDLATKEGSITTLSHEKGGLEADISAYSGVVAVSWGATSSVNTKALLEAQLSDVADIAEADWDVYTGTHDFWWADDLEIPNSATPTVDTNWQIAIDTTVTDFSHGIMKYYSGEEIAIIGVPIAELTSPTNGNAILYNSTNDEFELWEPTIDRSIFLDYGSSLTATTDTFTHWLGRVPSYIRLTAYTYEWWLPFTTNGVYDWTNYVCQGFRDLQTGSSVVDWVSQSTSLIWYLYVADSSASTHNTANFTITNFDATDIELTLALTWGSGSDFVSTIYWMVEIW